MNRRSAVVVAVVAIFAVGVGAWFAYTRYGPPSGQALVGKWEGTGQSRSVMTIGNEKATVRFASTSKAEFRPDGTYTWESVAHAGGEGGQINLTLSLPKDGEPAPKWEVVRKGGRTYLKWHMGETEIEFQGNDTFTVRWSQTDDEGSDTFRRVP